MASAQDVLNRLRQLARRPGKDRTRLQLHLAFDLAPLGSYHRFTQLKRITRELQTMTDDAAAACREHIPVAGN